MYYGLSKNFRTAVTPVKYILIYMISPEIKLPTQTFFDTYSREVKFSVNLFSMQKYAQKYFVYDRVYQQHAQRTHPLTRTHTHTLSKCIQNKLCKIFEASTTLFQQRLKSTYTRALATCVARTTCSTCSRRNSGNILLNASSTHVACVTQKKKERLAEKKKREKRSEISENLYKIKLIKWT